MEDEKKKRIKKAPHYLHIDINLIYRLLCQQFFSAATVRRRRNWNIILVDVKTKKNYYMDFFWLWCKAGSEQKVIQEVVIVVVKAQNTVREFMCRMLLFFIDGNYEIYAGVRVTRDMLRWMIIKTHFARFGGAVVFMGVERLNFYILLSLQTLRMIIIMIYELSTQLGARVNYFLSLSLAIFNCLRCANKKIFYEP